MANRFSRYQNVDYVGMPIQAYQMVMGVKEAEYQQRLDESRNSYDAMNAIETAANPDADLKASIMDNINNSVAGLATKNLKGSDTLMALNKLVNDPQSVNALASIYSNTINIKAKQAADQKYQEEYGNDINVRETDDEFAAYNRLGKEGFKTGIFKGYTPGKFVDINKDIQETMSKMKDDGWTQMSTGKWITKNMKVGISLEKALSVAGLELGDPKYQSQLKKIGYYGLSNMGLDETGIPGALNRYNTGRAEHTSNLIADYAKGLADIKSKQAKDPKHARSYDKAIEEGMHAIQRLKEKRDGYLSDTEGHLYRQDMIENMARIAGTPTAHMVQTMSKVANPFELQANHAALDLSNWKKKYDYKKADEEAAANTPEQLIQFSGPGSVYADAFRKEFGDNIGVSVSTKKDIGVGLAVALTPLVAPFGFAKLMNSIHDAGNIRVSDPAKLNSFAQFAISNGFPINKALIDQGGSTKESSAEISKLMNIHSTLKNGKDNVGFGVSLSSGYLDNQKVSNYVLTAINASSGIIMDENGKPQKVNDLFGSTNDEKLSKIYSGISGKTINVMLQPMSGLVGINMGGKTYFVKPDQGTQELNQGLTNLLNPSTILGQGSVRMGTRDVPMMSLSIMKNDGNSVNKMFFQPLTQTMTKDKANQYLVNKFGKEDMDMFVRLDNLPSDQAVMMVQVPGKGLTYFPYNEFENSNGNMKFPSNANIEIIAKDKSGQYTAIHPLDPKVVNAQMLINENTKGILKGPLQSLFPSKRSYQTDNIESFNTPAYQVPTQDKEE